MFDWPFGVRDFPGVISEPEKATERTAPGVKVGSNAGTMRAWVKWAYEESGYDKKV